MVRSSSVNLRKWGLAILAAGVCISAYVWLRDSEQRRIRKQLSALCARFSKPPGESNTVMALKMHTFPDLFADECELDLQNFPGSGVYTPAQIGSYAARVRPGFESISLTFHDSRIRLDSDTDAVVTLTARLTMKPKDSTLTEDIREVICRLKKVEDTWRFARFEEVAVLEK